ncbi:pentatricopeptide repeat-containing protein, putative [Ricinus communis]|uniref:Pentatricopeptide repeat-containing protein, putative n=1 Tax=Ricinus communis TaxID=3988 RepID=B9T445_RICCO|nr:pentatricopeptide repeat-containing protein, putative [Ricinus communis]
MVEIMFFVFGLVGVARKLFDEMPIRDCGSWNAMIYGYCQNENVIEVLDIVDEMRKDGVAVDAFAAASILLICAKLNDVLSGKLIQNYCSDTM